MRVVIDIPREFEDHFSEDRFEDTLHRLSADAHLLAGNYEQETAVMLISALQSATILPKDYGRLIDADKTAESIRASFTDASFEELLREADEYDPPGWIVDVVDCIQEVLNAPTILEANEKRQSNENETNLI